MILIKKESFDANCSIRFNTPEYRRKFDKEFDETMSYISVPNYFDNYIIEDLICFRRYYLKRREVDNKFYYDLYLNLHDITPRQKNIDTSYFVKWDGQTIPERVYEALSNFNTIIQNNFEYCEKFKDFTLDENYEIETSTKYQKLNINILQNNQKILNRSIQADFTNISCGVNTIGNFDNYLVSKNNYLSLSILNIYSTCNSFVKARLREKSFKDDIRLLEYFKVYDNFKIWKERLDAEFQYSKKFIEQNEKINKLLLDKFFDYISSKISAVHLIVSIPRNSFLDTFEDYLISNKIDYTSKTNLNRNSGNNITTFIIVNT